MAPRARTAFITNGGAGMTIKIPHHVAIVMDGNGRWAQQRGLPRTAGHEAGEAALFDVVEGAIEYGVKEISAYAFSTENWRRSPEEVKFLMGFNREVLRARRDQLNAWGVRIRWAGRRPRLWLSVIDELKAAEKLTAKNKTLTLTMCVNYGSRIEIVDAVNAMATDVASGKLKPGAITEKTVQKYLNSNYLPDVDLFLRSSGEQRTSNFLLWQSALSEFYFCEAYWPEFRRVDFLRALRDFSLRHRRMGK